MRTRCLGALVAASLVVCACRRKRAAPPPPTGHASALAAHRQSPHAYGRTGDLVLRNPSGAALTVATTEDVPGHRPLRGAVLDARADARDAPDPLLWWRPVWIDRQQRTHPVIAQEVRRARCPDGGDGILVRGPAHGVDFETLVCATPSGYVLTTRAIDPPSGVHLADEINPGSASVLIAGRHERWEGEFPSAWVALAEHGTAVVMHTTTPAGSPPPTARRHLVRISGETFPTNVLWVHDRPEFVRHLKVMPGDTLDALAAVPMPRGASPQVIDVVGPGALPATLEIHQRDGTLVTTGELTTARRRLVLPDPFADVLVVRDAWGIPSGPLEVQRTPHATTVRTPPLPSSTLSLQVTNEDERELPVRVLFRGEAGLADPTPRLAPGARGYASQRSVYLLDGRGTVHLPPGSYRVTVTRGPAYTLHEETVSLAPDATRTLRATLRRILPADGWVAGDFHLHAAPSPDSRVSLEERLASLACNGIDVAAATDHNRVTDYRAALERTALGRHVTLIAGDEVSSAGPGVWGHFNAFPLRVPPVDVAPEDAVPGYYDRSPGAIFRAARNAGASVVMVNHPRMPHAIGYFEQTHFNARTGDADDGFSDDFNALEVFNGLHIESPLKVREAVLDMVGLARRGAHVTAMGNSDSHHLFYEEAGYPRTYVRVRQGPPESLAARVIEAIREGRTSVSSGPFVEMTVNGASPGDTLRVLSVRDGALLRVHVRVSAPAWVPVDHVEIWRNDAVAERVSLQGLATDGVRYEGDHEIPIHGDTVILAWADADRPLPGVLAVDRPMPVGFTGLVRVDFDGDGAVRVPASR